MTQSDLGRAVDVTFQQIQKYEQGTSRMSAVMLFQLSQAMNVDFSAQFALEGARFVDSVRSRAEDRLLADFARLDADRQQLVLQLLEALGGT